MESLLPILLLIPVLGAILCMILPGEKLVRTLALVVSLVCATLTIPLLLTFNWGQAEQIQYVYDGPGLELGSLAQFFKFELGIDSISLWLIALTVFLQPLAIAASFASIRDRSRQYYGWMLALLAAMLGVFMARNALLFYVFFELTLIPMFFIIGIWGGPQRREAAGKFFLFTFSGSVFLLASLIYLGLKANTFDILQLVHFARTGALSTTELVWVAVGLLVGFAVKVPLFPVHTWLPLAHTEAPTAGSVILAGVLLKLGTYGILRFVVPIGFYTTTTDRIASWNITFVQVVAVLSICGVIYGALVAWVQQDIKKLVAYSSVSHLGFCVLGLAALNHEGMQGSVLYMINHGLSTGAMFLVIGMIYDRYHTRDINQLSGLARKMPVMAFFFILFTLSSIGLPGLNGFASEFLTILGAFKSEHLGPVYGGFAALGIILGAVYMLHMAARVIWGPLKTPHLEHGEEDHGPGLPTDLSAREVGILVPIALAVVIIGVIPGRLLNTFQAPVTYLLNDSTGIAQVDGREPAPTALALRTTTQAQK